MEQFEKFNALAVKSNEESIKQRLSRDGFAFSRLYGFVKNFELDLYLQGSILIKPNAKDIDFVVIGNREGSSKLIQEIKEFEIRKVSPLDTIFAKYFVGGGGSGYSLSEYTIKFTPRGILKGLWRPIDLSFYNQALFDGFFNVIRPEDIWAK